MTVDQRDPTPLHVQLASILRAEIAAGKYAETGILPSESYLQQTHGVARGRPSGKARTWSGIGPRSVLEA